MMGEHFKRLGLLSPTLAQKALVLLRSEAFLIRRLDLMVTLSDRR